MTALWSGGEYLDQTSRTSADPAGDALRVGGSTVRWLAVADPPPTDCPAPNSPDTTGADTDAHAVPGPLPIEAATARALERARNAVPVAGPRHAAPDPDETDQQIDQVDHERPVPAPGAAAPNVAAAAVAALPVLPAPAGTIDGLHHALASAFRRGAARSNGDAEVDAADTEAAVNAAVALCAAAPGESSALMARRTGEAVAAMTESITNESGEIELALPGVATRPVSWAGFGALLPVLSGSPGAGASVVAAALTDALQAAGRCTLLVDAADPARSGLAGAAAADGPWTQAPHHELVVRYSWREHALLARLESALPMVTPGMVPPPPAWLPELDPLHVTVVDLGHDGWRATANPLVGAGGWLRCGTPTPRPLLVVRPTRPSLRHAEQVLARLDPWIAAGCAVAPVAMVVVGAKRWPAGVAGAAGHRVAHLVDDAVFLPHDPQVETGGITDELLPDRLLEAVTPLLAGWGLMPLPGRSSRRTSRTQGRR